MEININELVKIEQMAVIKQQLDVVGEEIKKKVDTIPGVLEEFSKLDSKEQEEKKQEIKKYRTYLSSIQKQLEEKRKEIKKEINKPYDEFNTYYEDNVKVLLTNGINQLDTTISDIEKKQINEKQIEIEEFIKEHILSNHLESIVDVVDVIEYANLKINLSTSIKSLKESALSFISKVADEVKLIDLEETPSNLLYEYQRNGYDLTKAKLTLLERQKEIEELAKQREKEVEEIKQEEVIEEQIEDIVKPPIEINEEKETELVKSAFEVECTIDDLIAIKKLFEDRNIKYRNIEVKENE